MLTLAARAKVNLCLDVLRRRDDGYHEVDMIMQSISLHDIVMLEPCAQIALCGDLAGTPQGPDNLVWRAAALMLQRAPENGGVRITLRKYIPVAAGLGGGSADAAAVIVGLNELWELHMPVEEMEAVGAGLGADIPFCIRGGCARATGIGTALDYLADAPQLHMVLYFPDIPVSTAEVYRRLRVPGIPEHPDVGAVWNACRQGRSVDIVSSWGNVLEGPAFQLHPELAVLKDEFARISGKDIRMSGSGSSMFCLCPDEAEAKDIASRLRAQCGPGFIDATQTEPTCITFWRE